MASSEDVYRREIGSVVANAARAFADHVLVAEGGYAPAQVYSWSIARPGDSAYSAQIVSLSAGALLVHGDIDAVVFQRSDRSLEARPFWLRGELSEYVMEKARIGSGEERAMAWNRYVFFAHAAEYAAEYVAEGRDVPEWLANMIDIGESIHAHTVSRERLLSDAHDDGAESDDMEALCELGKVPSARLIYAHAAINRLCDLLDTREPRGGE